ncbi:hypothetical protein ARMSODRAFT_1066331 [Armillaria solidipes]|uniref:Uncharacterized protein n=1 Tax=Armillaria solidipes TaxID=1076256 RepID=A0A2H3APK2_9AGAR|nr:hypothetical protein ARMSODRAFT_1066331 [Armillaria solidipes]
MSSDSKTASADETRPEAPIDVLPDDILLEIFSWGARSSNNTSFSFLVSTICQSWRSLAISDPRLWTALTVIITSADDPLPIPTDPSFFISLVFPRETLIVDRSGDQDIDFYLEYESSGDEETERFTETHYLVLSQLLADIAHRIRTFRVTTLDWPEIHQLCARLKRIAMPRLETCHLTALCSEIRVYMDVYEEVANPIQVLEYAQGDDTLPVTSQDLQTCGSLLYPALNDVCCSGIPMDWELFCASNLRVLYLENQPSEERPSMKILRGILSNSKDTLEYLELTHAIGLDEELADPPPSESRLTLPYVKQMKLVYIDPREAQQILRAFDFPALRTLVIKSYNEDEDNRDVLVDVLNYVRVEELLDLTLVGISLPPEDFPERELNGAEEKSLPLILQFLRRLTRGHLYKLVLEYCCDDFLKFMNYGNESGGGKVNLSGLKGLIVKACTEDASVGIMSFIRNRLERGTVDGVYAGPVLEDLIIIVKPNVQEEAESLGDLKLAKDGGFFFYLRFICFCHPSSFDATRAVDSETDRRSVDSMLGDEVDALGKESEFEWGTYLVQPKYSDCNTTQPDVKSELRDPEHHSPYKLDGNSLEELYNYIVNKPNVYPIQLKNNVQEEKEKRNAKTLPRSKKSGEMGIAL